MIANLIDTFMREQKLRGNTCTTQIYYRDKLGMFNRYCDEHSIRQLDITVYNDYKLYLLGRGIRNTSVHTHLRAVKALLRFHIEEETLPDFSKKIKLVKTEKDLINPLSPDEIHAILGHFAAFEKPDYLNDRNRCIWTAACA